MNKSTMTKRLQRIMESIFTTSAAGRHMAAVSGAAVVLLAAAAAAGAASAAGLPTACGPRAGDGSTVRVPVSSQGATYEVPVHVPAGYRIRRRLPLIFNLHGSFESGTIEEATTGTDAVADEQGFAVAYPNGSAYMALPGTGVAGYVWTIPGVPYVGGTYPPPGTRDDVRFISDAIDAIAARLCIDERRVYVTGYSNGARMASWLACALSDRVAAVAPVAGVRAGNPDPADSSRPDPDTCRPSRPVPVIAFHGKLDLLAPYEGGGSAYWGYAVPAALARWAQLDGCTAGPATVPVTATVDRVAYSGCTPGADVELYRSSIAGHTWPGAPGTATLGPVDMSISASELMWRFFAAHPLPEN